MLRRYIAIAEIGTQDYASAANDLALAETDLNEELKPLQTKLDSLQAEREEEAREVEKWQTLIQTAQVASKEMTTFAMRFALRNEWWEQGTLFGLKREALPKSLGNHLSLLDMCSGIGLSLLNASRLLVTQKLDSLTKRCEVIQKNVNSISLLADTKQLKDTLKPTGPISLQ
jgi:hypothetical protein